MYSTYHSAISTVDVQALFRDIRAEHTVEMHGLSVNRVAHVPQTISEEGWQRVQQDPEIIQSDLETSRYKTDILSSYSTLSAAVRACDARIQDLMSMITRRKNRRRLPLRAISKEEYRTAFRSDKSLQCMIDLVESGSILDPAPFMESQRIRKASSHLMTLRRLALLTCIRHEGEGNTETGDPIEDAGFRLFPSVKLIYFGYNGVGAGVEKVRIVDGGDGDEGAGCF